MAGTRQWASYPLKVSRKTPLRLAHQAVCAGLSIFPRLWGRKEKGEEAEDSSCAASPAGRAAMKEERKSETLRQGEGKHTCTHTCTRLSVHHFLLFVPFGELKLDNTVKHLAERKVSKTGLDYCFWNTVRTNNIVIDYLNILTVIYSMIKKVRLL